MSISSQRNPFAIPSVASKSSRPARRYMQPESKDAAYLWDMLDAARAIQKFVLSRSFEDYRADRMLAARRSGSGACLNPLSNSSFTIQNSEFSQPLTPDTRHPKPAVPSCHSPLATALSVTRPATSPSTSSPKSPPPFAQPLTPDTRNLPLHEVARSCPSTPRLVYAGTVEERRV